MRRERYETLELSASAALFFGSLVLNRFAGAYIDKVGETAHTSPDLLLGFLPIVDMRFLYLGGFAVFAAMAVLHTLWRERPRAAYIARNFALLIAARSALMILTPMKVPAGTLAVDGYRFYDTVGRFFTARNDLFFSLHTGIPFMGFLVFTDRAAKRACLAFSLIMAATVLLGRHHYSIDVAGAYLITYSLYRLEKRWFEAPYRSFMRGLDGALKRGEKPSFLPQDDPSSL